MKHAPYPKIVRLEAYRRLTEIKYLNAQQWRLSQEQGSHVLAASDIRMSTAFRDTHDKAAKSLQPQIDELRSHILAHKFWLYTRVPKLVERIMSLQDYLITYDGICTTRGKFSRVNISDFFFRSQNMARKMCLKAQRSAT